MRAGPGRFARRAREAGSVSPEVARILDRARCLAATATPARAAIEQLLEEAGDSPERLDAAWLLLVKRDGVSPDEPPALLLRLATEVGRHRAERRLLHRVAAAARWALIPGAGVGAVLLERSPVAFGVLVAFALWRAVAQIGLSLDRRRRLRRVEERCDELDRAAAQSPQHSGSGRHPQS